MIVELRKLYAQIELAADWSIQQYEAICEQQGIKPSSIELGLSSDDREAKQRGFPCIGAHAAALGIVAARVECAVHIVPAGSTLATAAAADQQNI